MPTLLSGRGLTINYLDKVILKVGSGASVSISDCCGSHFGDYEAGSLCWREDEKRSLSFGHCYLNIRTLYRCMVISP